MGMEDIQYGWEHARLERLLRSVDRPGDYCVGGRLYTPMPRVVVDGAGELSFPLREAQIEALTRAAERAPYGKGAETLVDTSVRDCRQIGAGSVRLAGRAWPDSFAAIMDLVAAGLGVPGEQLGAELYKLLVYRTGGFFAPHRDTEKVPGMVATLSVSLPAPGAGGELVVRHGERETTFDMSAEEPSELAFAAFYADCLHEVLPVTKGHRVSLVFNLFLRSPEEPPGAPDYADLASPVAECLSEWRRGGATEKLVWLLDHEYSEDGLSFGTLKNTDAAVGKVLAEAAKRAGCESHAAVLRIEVYGSPEYEPVYDRWSREWEVDESAEMHEVIDRWETLDGWAALDGGRPPFGPLPLHEGELLPRGALDDAEPDERRLEGSTGNAGATLELTYRHAALVVWPSEKTVDVVAGGGIDGAVSWAAMECARASDAERGGVRRLLARLTELWPAGEEGYGKRDRAAMLQLLRGEGEADIAADFLRRVVMADYDGSENDALAALMPLIGPEAAGGFLPGFLEAHLPRRPREIITVLALVGGNPAIATSPAWRAVLSEVVGGVLSSLGGALDAGGVADGDRENDWTRGWRTFDARLDDEPPPDPRMDHGAVRDLFVLAWRLGLADEAASAAHVIGDHPEAVTPDRMLPAALSEMRGHGGLARTAAYGTLWRLAADFLLARSSAPPVEPGDWTVAAEIPCTCEHCAKLRAFCRDPVARVERFKVRKDLRKHLHRTIDAHRLDLYHKTERRGSPYTLVCTKNRASHERRLKRYAQDLLRMESLLESAPEREQGGTRAGGIVSLERALELGKRS